MVLNNGIAPCGTMSRCCCCNMRLVCAKSPYCSIGGNSSDKKLDEIEALIQQLIQSQAVVTQALADLETKADTAQTSLNNLTNNVATVQETCDMTRTVLGEFQQDTKQKLDEIYAKVENINSASTQGLDTPIDVDSSDVSEDDSKSLAVLKPKEEETILVEKKGLFGKSKWVEQKQTK